MDDDACPLLLSAKCCVAHTVPALPLGAGMVWRNALMTVPLHRNAKGWVWDGASRDVQHDGLRRTVRAGHHAVFAVACRYRVHSVRVRIGRRRLGCIQARSEDSAAVAGPHRRRDHDRRTPLRLYSRFRLHLPGQLVRARDRDRIRYRPRDGALATVRDRRCPGDRDRPADRNLPSCPDARWTIGAVGDRCNGDVQDALARRHFGQGSGHESGAIDRTRRGVHLRTCGLRGLRRVRRYRGAVHQVHTFSGSPGSGCGEGSSGNRLISPVFPLR